MKRREFIKKAAVIGIGSYGATRIKFISNMKSYGGKKMSPVIISTWNHGLEANEAAYRVLSSGGTSLDAVEKGANVVEDDPAVSSVGYGGLPDEQMDVTLDAAIMDWRGNAGAVGCLEKIKNPISVARKVMQNSRHVMLVGDGAYQFAIAHGFKPIDLLTDNAREQWLRWKESWGGNWIGKNEENHDTVGIIAIDSKRRISGGVSTSGLAWKIHGRVGDSPIIGAGLYVDGEVGGAASTGVGEANMRIVGSHVVVEAMRSGKSPQEACEEAIHRAIKMHLSIIRREKSFQLAYIALNLNGEFGAASIRPGFQYAVYKDGVNKLINSKFLYNG
ncbi:MAG: N(4)-(beta-N-acetylglucosaminyl)-L-asparaginase [Candidatus Kryptoniota bacterium]